MKGLRKARKKYEEIEIPKELETVVEQAVKKTSRKISFFPKRIAEGVAAAAAAIVLITTIMLNTSEAFARGVQEIPALAGVAKILTFREYNTQDSDQHIHAEIPKIESESDFAMDVNQEIQKKCEDYLKEADIEIAEYKAAFLDTGGTEEEFKAHDIKVDVSYDVKSQTKEFLSFVVTGTQSWSGAYGKRFFYNLDITNGKYIELKDVLGDDYIDKANKQIQEQLEERVKEDSNLQFFTKEEGGFSTIHQSEQFYINENGNPVIVFDKYEIAPGYMGEVEFEIRK
ncbi:MAG: RsiV family protein [Lachnospiraceae bacterium]